MVNIVIISALNFQTRCNLFRTNTCGTDVEEGRSDAEMAILKQRTMDYTVGSCEVKLVKVVTLSILAMT